VTTVVSPGKDVVISSGLKAKGGTLVSLLDDVGIVVDASVKLATHEECSLDSGGIERVTEWVVMRIRGAHI